MITRVSSPLTETTFFIMLSLATGPRHGYSIMKDVEVISDARIVLGTGTLYGALRRLLEHGWIRRVEDTPGETNRPRKVYALTSLGQSTLNAEVARLQALVTAAHLRTSPGQV